MGTDFSPMERMLEMGLGLGLAQQMMRTMNECMQTTQVPQVTLQSPQMPSTDNRQYYAVVDEKVSGPFSESELTVMSQNQKLKRDTYVWKQGMQNWVLAQDVPEVNKILILLGL